MTEWTAPADEGPDELLPPDSTHPNFNLLQEHAISFDAMTEKERYELFKQMKRKDSIILPPGDFSINVLNDPSVGGAPIVPPIAATRRRMLGLRRD